MTCIHDVPWYKECIDCKREDEIINEGVRATLRRFASAVDMAPEILGSQGPAPVYRYWILSLQGHWCEVSKEAYVNSERKAGFNNTLGQPDEPATSYFSNGFIEGRITLGPEPPPRVPTMDEIREHYKLT